MLTTINGSEKESNLQIMKFFFHISSRKAELPRKDRLTLLSKEVHQDDMYKSRSKRCLNIPGFPNFCGNKVPKKRPPPPPLKPYELGPGFPIYSNSSGYESTTVTPPVTSQVLHVNATPTHQIAKGDHVGSKIEDKEVLSTENTIVETRLPSIITPSSNRPHEDTIPTSVQKTTIISSKSVPRINAGNISVSNSANEDVQTPKLVNKSAQDTIPSLNKTIPSITTKPFVTLTKTTIKPVNKSAPEDIPAFVETSSNKLVSKSSEETNSSVENRTVNLENKTSPESNPPTVLSRSYSSIQPAVNKPTTELAYKVPQPVYNQLQSYPYERSFNPLPFNYNSDPFQRSSPYYSANQQFIQPSPFAHNQRNFYFGELLSLIHI